MFGILCLLLNLISSSEQPYKVAFILLRNMKMIKVYNLPLNAGVANSRQVNEPSSDSKAWNIFFTMEQLLRLYCMFLHLWLWYEAMYLFFKFLWVNYT